MQTFLVHRTLDGDMRKSSIGQTRRASRRVEFGVRRHLSHGADALGDTANYDLSEELSKGQPSFLRVLPLQEPTKVKKTWTGVSATNATRR